MNPRRGPGISIQRIRLALEQQNHTVNAGGHTHTKKNKQARAQTQTQGETGDRKGAWKEMQLQVEGGAHTTRTGRARHAGAQEAPTNARRAETRAQAHREGEGNLQVDGRKGKGRKRAVRPG